MQDEISHQTPSTSLGKGYTSPTSGILSHLPANVIPFGELIRLDKPVGVFYLYTQCASGTLLAALLAHPVVTPSHLVVTNILLLISSALFRAAACSWNDTADREIDKKVSRTRLRPVARGAVSTTAAHACTGSVFFVVMILQSQLPRLSGQSQNLRCVYYSIPFIIAAGVYPFSKRVTHYPQLILGFMMSWGIWVAFPSLGINLFTSGARVAGAACMTVSVVSWTALYDTIYAFQDIKDDLKADVKSMAIRHKNHAKLLFERLAVVQVLALLPVGYVAKAGLMYYIGILIVWTLLRVVIKGVDLDEPKSCAWWFHGGCHLVSVTMVCSLLIEYIVRFLGASVT